MPQIGQLPGPSRTTSGCMGQVHFAAGSCGLAGSSAMPHLGQAPARSDSTPAHIGQIQADRPGARGVDESAGACLSCAQHDEPSGCEWSGAG